MAGARRPLRTEPAALRLVDTKTTSTGVTVDVYQPAGEPTHGSFEASDSVTITEREQ